MSQPINNFSEQLQNLLDKALPQEGEVLIFERRHQAQPQEAFNEENRPVQWHGSPGPYRLMRKETIIDPGTKRPITIANVVDWAATGPAGAMEPVIEEVAFPGQEHRLYVGPENPVLAARLLLSDKNADSINPSKRTPDMGHVFERVKPDVTAANAYDQEMKVLDALSAIRQLEDDREQLDAVISKLEIPTLDRGRTLTEKELLSRLVALAKVSPERVTNALTSEEAKLEQLVAKAVQLELVTFVDETQQWRWKATQEPITEAVQGFKPAVALVRYIQQNANGPAFSQMLAGRVKQAEKDAEKTKKAASKSAAAQPAA